MSEGRETTRMTVFPGHQQAVAKCRPIAECRPMRLLSLEQPAPSCTKKEFWSAGLREIPSFACNPWDFYKPFFKLSSGTRLVLCNDKTTVRVIKGYDTVPLNESGYGFPLFQIQHKNFVDIYESYLFKGEVSAIIEYVGLSLEDLLQNSICFSEPEIAYIISQVSRALSSFHPTDVVAFGWHKFYLVKETRSRPYIHTKYPVVSKRRG
jgi:serine/threonine protein kinase